MANGADSHALLFDDGLVTDFCTLGGTDSVAFDINNAGQIVGHSFFAGPPFPPHAFLFEGAVMTDLSTLPKVQAAGWSFPTYAEELNNRGQIAGGGVSNRAPHAFLLTPSGRVLEPYTLFLVMAVARGPMGAEGRPARKTTGPKARVAVDTMRAGHLVGERASRYDTPLLSVSR